MQRVCIEIATGKMLTSQSGGDELHPHQVVDAVKTAYDTKYAEDENKPILSFEDMVIEFADDLESVRTAYRQTNLDVLLTYAIDTLGFAANEVEAFFEDDADYAVRLAAQAESERTYVDKRKAAYPNPMKLNDALVKQQSSDPVIVAEGQAQEMQYYSDCLQVKEDFPKPE